MKKTILAAIAALSLATPAVAVSEGVLIGQVVSQMKLNDLGYDVGKPDGVMGKKTMAAIKADSEKHGYEYSVWGFQGHYIGVVVRGSKELTSEYIQTEVKAKLEDILLDTQSAQYKNWRTLPSGNVCVDVNSKNLYGAYTGYKPVYINVSYIAVIVGGKPVLGYISDNELGNFWRCTLDA